MPDGPEMRAVRLPDEKVEEALTSGAHADLLAEYFGGAAYSELRQLALEASRRSVRGGPRVLILPGIMGSRLGRRGPILDDALWVDPVDIARGRLRELILPDGAADIEALGVILFAYLKLKLRLRLVGYDADFYPFDWRKGLPELGAKLAQRLENEPAAVNLVAHSMGGLVARAGLARNGRKVRRLVMLGTPNFGSFAPVQVFRAVHAMIQKVALVDLANSAGQLCGEVFNTFPALYQMLPWREKFSSLDLFDSSVWPQTGPRPRPELLADALAAHTQLAAADDRFFLVAGVNQSTVTGARIENGEFVYEYSLDGDGTVPLAFAQIDGAKTYYVEAEHGSLPNNGAAEKAVIDILAEGKTSVLPETRPAPSRALARSVAENDLAKSQYFDGRRGGELTPDDIRSVLAEFAAPDSEARPVAVESERFDGIVVGRRRQFRLDLRLVQGSITDVDSRAYVLGIFRDVAPSGPALALDARLDGSIREFTTRRMLTGNVGEVFIMPTGRHPVRADIIVLAGLGTFDTFDEKVQQLTAENVVRTLIRTNVEEFATLLMGGGSGRSVGDTLRNLLEGFFLAVRDADKQRRLRTIMLCERDEGRFQELKRELYRLSSTRLFDDIEVTLDEVHLPPSPEEEARALRRPAAAQPAYLIVREEGVGDHTVGFRSSVLTAGAKATVVQSLQTVRKQELDDHLATLDSAALTFDAMDGFGERLAQLVLGDDIRTVLAQPNLRDLHLVVVHDLTASRIPWETMRVDGWSPAAGAGLSRRYLAANLSIAKWLEQRREEPTLDILLVVNPTEDLPGAKDEGDRISALFESHHGIRIQKRVGREARKSTLFEDFQSGNYDVVHYAGHAYFDRQNPARSGILCAGKEILSGQDLATVGNLPSLMFFNACEAGRIRKADASDQPDIHERVERNVSLAEAFLRGGVANYIGTYWPVGDNSAKKFAVTFYQEILQGRSIGDALGKGRAEVRAMKSVDWADYILYGSHEFVLKTGGSS